ncbi:Membrane attack complex component/perforin (MACPF) domain [Trinorchestia longiramus]|nr:Membrane attack complex component/perforin (MACPF) domain [Trinorchestia longiramus]
MQPSRLARIEEQRLLDVRWSWIIVQKLHDKHTYTPTPELQWKIQEAPCRKLRRSTEKMASVGFILTAFLPWLSLTRANTMWFHTGSDKKISPVPNFELSLRGYDIVFADPFQSKDPGFRDQIFEPFYKDNGRTYFYSFIDEVELNKECDSNFTFTRVSNSSELFREKSVDYSFFLGAVDDQSEKSVFTANPEKQASSSWDNDVVIGRAKCVTHRVQIAPFEKPVFTENFRNALRVFHEAAKDPLSLRSRETTLMFFLTYGTHFMKTIELGSKVIVSKSASTHDGNVTEECLRSAIAKNMKAGDGSSKISASSLQKYFKDCSETNESSATAKHDSDVQLSVRGAFPNGEGDWAGVSKASPLPIGAELVKLSYFFRDQWLDFLEENGTRNLPLDTSAMYELYEIYLSFYCHKVLGVNCATSTLKEIEGRYSQKMDQKLSQHKLPLTDMASDQPRQEEHLKFNAFIVSGGFAGLHTALGSIEVFSDTLIFNTTLPELPLKLGGHSLVAVGSVLYNCGGSTPWSLSDMFLQCYELNITSPSPTWLPTFKLPQDMKTFHTALSVGSDIWFFDRGSFTVYVYQYKSKAFNQFFLPFFTSSEMCFVKLGASSIAAVDTAQSLVYILKHPSDPQDWQVIPTVLETRYSPACVAIDSLIYITGDRRSEISEDYEVFDINLEQVHLIPTFDQPRIGYGLTALDGVPAAIGGMVKNGKTILSTIEVYDSVGGKWKTLDRQLSFPRTLFGVSSFNIS